MFLSLSGIAPDILASAVILFIIQAIYNGLFTHFKKTLIMNDPLLYTYSFDFVHLPTFTFTVFGLTPLIAPHTTFPSLPHLFSGF